MGKKGEKEKEKRGEKGSINGQEVSNDL